MTECELVRQALQDGLDGELSPAERRRVDAHLATCVACRQVAAGYRRLFAALDGPVLPAPRPAFVAGVMRRVTAERARERRWQSWVGVAAMLMVGVAGALMVWGQVAAAGWALPADMGLVAAGHTLWEVMAEIAGNAAAWGGACVTAVPGGPVPLAAMGVLLVASGALAYHWRDLAQVDDTNRARVTR